MKKRSFAAVILLLFLLVLGNVCLASEADEKGKIIYVYVTACGSCEEAQKALDDISPDIDIEKINILDDIDRVNQLFDEYQVPEEDRIAPIVFSGASYFSGSKEIRKNIGLIEQSAQKAADKVTSEAAFSKETSTEGVSPGGATEASSGEPYKAGIKRNDHQSSASSVKSGAAGFLSSFSIGAVNGLNPCALSMLLLLLSVLLQAGQNAAGYAFLFLGVKFIVYLLIGTVFLQVFQRWDPTWLPFVTKWILTVFSIAMIFLNIYDAVSIKKGEYGKVKDQLPKSVRKFLRLQISGVTPKRFMGVSVSLLAVIVALSEFLCSGQIYLATLLTTIERGMNIRNFGYLAVYCFAFLLPSLVVCILVMAGKNRAAISDWFLDRMFLVKVLNSIVFSALVIIAWVI